MESESGKMIVQVRKSGLRMLAIGAGATMLFWLWMSIAAFVVGGITHLLILPVALLGVAFFGWLAYWAIRRSINIEPAMIIDEVGIYDNISLVNAGRMRWRETERVWIMGPRWFQFLCIRPENLSTYLDSQEQFKGTMMRTNVGIWNAPVVIPMAILDKPQEDVWYRVVQVAAPHRDQTADTPRNLVTGA